jgi:hypothetical protein
MSSKFSFFGKVDRNKDGRVSSEYPAWMLPVHRENLAEDIDSMKRRLRSGEVELEARVSLKEEVVKAEKRLDEIDRSKPSITAPRMDKMNKHYDELSKLIADAMYTQYEDQKGFADAHEELKRMKSPCILVDADLAYAANIQVNEEGLVSRDAATKLWKIMGNVLGKTTNVERLRKKQ